MVVAATTRPVVAQGVHRKRQQEAKVTNVQTWRRSHGRCIDVYNVDVDVHRVACRVLL